MLNQRLTALKGEKESLEADVARQDAQIRALQSDKIVLQSDVNVLKAQRDRLVLQKRQLRVIAVLLFLCARLSSHRAPVFLCHCCLTLPLLSCVWHPARTCVATLVWVK